MLRYTFSAFFFLLLLMFCVSSEATKTAEQENSLETPNKVAAKDDASNAKALNIPDLRKVSFVGVTGTIVALIQTADNSGKQGTFIKYFRTQEENWGEEIPKDASKNEELPTGFKLEKEEKVALAMVAKDNKIYIFAASKPQPTETFAQDKKWKFKFAVGTINNDAGQTWEKRINWENEGTTVSLNVDEFQTELSDVSPSDATAFLTEEGALVIVVRATKDSDNNDKKGFVVVHSNNAKTNFEIISVNTTPDCHSSFFLWGTKLFMVPEFCGRTPSNEIPKVQQSADMGRTWTDADEPLATKLNNLKGGKAFFTTTTVDNKRVLLFTEEKTGHGVRPKRVSINLFMSNDNCIENLGEIISNVSYVPYGSIVHTKDELFFFGNIFLNTNYYIVVRRLKTQLDRITATLNESKCVEEKKLPRDPQKNQLNNAGSKEEKEEKTLDVFQEDHLNPTTPQEDTTQLRESGDNSVHLRAGMAVVLLLCLLSGL